MECPHLVGKGYDATPGEDIRPSQPEVNRNSSDSTLSQQGTNMSGSRDSLSDDWELVEQDSEPDSNASEGTASDQDYDYLPELETTNLAIDIPLSRQERRKDLSHVLARINLFLHDLDWTGFEKYASQLSSTKNEHRRHDYEACVRLNRCYVMRVTTGALPALQALEDSREFVQSAPSRRVLVVRYLAMKAFLMYFMGRQDEATTLHEEAIHMSVMLEPNNPSALNLYYYALNSVLHNRKLWDGHLGIPLEQTWQKAEFAYRESCNHNQSWVHDLDEDPMMGEAHTSFFYILTFIKYIMCLLRTCAAPEGFYRLMTKEHGVTVDTLERVQQYLDHAESQYAHMFPRCRLYFYLAKCDFYIRSFQKGFHEKDACIKEAYQWAVLARELPTTFNESKLSRFLQEFGLCRLNYVDKRLKGMCDEPDACPMKKVHLGSFSSPPEMVFSSCPESRFTPLVISREMSHMDVFKKHQDSECKLDDCGVFKVT